MDAGEDRGLSPRAKRGLPLIAAALAMIVVAGLLYLRASAPRPPVTLSVPPPIAVLPSRFQVTYDFLGPSLGWSLVLDPGSVASTLWVFKTTDGAKHWVQQFTGATQGVGAALQFFDRNTGVITFGYNSTTFFRTRDGGRHWQP